MAKSERADDGGGVSRAEIPDDATLDDMGDEELAELARETGAGFDTGKKATSLRRDLRKWRDDGLLLECNRCGHTWTYGGESAWRTNCPTCGSSHYLGKLRGEEWEQEQAEAEAAGADAGD